MLDVSRRTFMEALSALTMTRLQEHGIDPEDPQYPEDGDWYVGKLEIEGGDASWEMPYSYCEGVDLKSAEILTVFDSESPYIILETERNDFRFGLLNRLTAAEARELAVHLYQAAWEFEHRVNNE